MMRVECRDCEYPFDIKADDWLDRGLAIPKRCPRCRAARRGPRVQGIVVRYDPHRRGGFGVIATDEGERLVVAHFAVEASDLPLIQGERVEFEIEDGSPLRRAARVWRTEGRVAP